MNRLSKLGRSRFEMPVNVAMKEPRSGVVRVETECNIVACSTDIDSVATDGICVVVCRTASDSYDIKRMLDM